MKLFGRSTKMNESTNNQYVVANPKDKKGNNDDQYDPLVLPDYNLMELVSKLRNLNDSYKYRYAEYREMEHEVMIQSALELYADDATQVDTRTSKIVAITSNDNVLQNDLNALIAKLEIDDRIWNWAYTLAQYGDIFLKVHYDENNNLRLEEAIDPSLIMDLYKDGQRVAYAEEDASEYQHMKRSNGNLQLIIHNPHDFIHGMISKTGNYDIVEIPILNEKDDKGDPLIIKYQVNRGVSMIESVRSIYRLLQLSEDSMIAAKLAKAEFIRIFNVEVGQSTPAQTSQVVNTIKNMFDSKATFNVQTGRYSAKKMTRPIGDPIINPVRNGSGNISHESIGGDFQVRDIADIDYLNNKLFAGLKIPKSFLGFEESLPGGLGNDNLTRLDIRYSRTIKRLQNPLISMVQDICLNWLDQNGRSVSKNDFQVILQAPSTAEELSRITELSTKLDIINNMIDSMSKAFDTSMNLPKLYHELFNYFTNYPELSEQIDPIMKDAIKRYEKMQAEQDSADKESERY